MQNTNIIPSLPPPALTRSQSCDTLQNPTTRLNEPNTETHSRYQEQIDEEILEYRKQQEEQRRRLEQEYVAFVEHFDTVKDFHKIRREKDRKEKELERAESHETNLGSMGGGLRMKARRTTAGAATLKIRAELSHLVKLLRNGNTQ